DPSGKAKNVKIPEELSKEMAKLNKTVGDAGLSVDPLKPLFGQGGLLLPNYSASKGKVWEHTTVSKMPGGKITIRHAYEHEGTVTRGGRRLEVIAIKPTSKFESDGTGGVTLKSQNISGKAYVDKGAGRLVETTIDQQMELEMK